MITHCPYCHTHFRVHPDQLAARAGQVRCGKCTRAFDALEYLIEEAGRSAESQTAPAAGGTEAETPSIAAQAPRSETAATPEPAEIALPEREPDFAAIIEPRVNPPETAADMRQEPALAAAPAAVEAIEPDAHAFGFGPAAAAKTAGRAKRWAWILGSILLSLVLLGQAAYYYRSTIVVLFPEAKPYATAMCAKLGCDLPLPQRVDLLSIEASDLQADTTNPNVMVLSATLRNRAIFDQQFPLLELTLTDAQDQPLVRRVLTPQDYVGKAAGKQPGFGANSEMAVKVFIEGSQVKATGYRLYLFYP